MIELNKYDDKNETLYYPTEVELKIEYGFKQHFIILDRLTDNYIDINIENIDNPHLKEICLSLSNDYINSELINIYNDKNHKIIDIKIRYRLFNMKDCDDDKKYTDFEIKNTIMYIDTIELITSKNELPSMKIYLKGHMVI